MAGANQILSHDEFAAIMATNPAKAEKLLDQFRKTIVVPHSGGQVEVLAAQERFQVACCGRRWGKSKIAAKKALAQCREPGKVVWWVAPTYKIARRGYREVLRQIPPGVLIKPPPTPTSNELILLFPDDTRMEFYSAENPDSMAGEGVDYVVVDEAALIRDSVWDQIIRPTLMDKQGSAFLISTPRGYNYFYRLWKRGQDGAEDYASWHHPTEDSPYIGPREIEEARETLPQAIFEQEIMAQFISNAAAVFRGLPEATRELAEIRPGDHVMLGIDLAKRYDFTVISGSRVADRLPVWHERFNDVSWPVQRERIRTAVAKIESTGASVTILMDATGVGDVVYDDLEEDGLDIIPITFSNQWKSKAVTLLSADIERGNAFLLEEQIQEFQSYGYTITSTGRMTYSAPENGHDDEVSAKLLEHWGHVHGGIPNVMMIEADHGGPSNHPLLTVGSEDEEARDEAGLSDGEWEEVDAEVVPDSWNPRLWA